MKIEDAAKALSRSENTIRNWISSGIISARKIGRFWDITIDEVERIKRDGLSLDKKE